MFIFFYILFQLLFILSRIEGKKMVLVNNNNIAIIKVIYCFIV